MYKTETEFLAKYNPNKYEKLSISTDIIIFSVSDKAQTNYRKTTKKHMSILLVERQNYPFKNKWCLPGGFLRINEELEECPKRILYNETNLKNIYLEQLYTFGEISRDPRMRIISTSYMALIDKNKITDTLNTNTAWFDINIKEKNNIVQIELTNEIEKIEFTIQKTIREHTTDRYKFKEIKNNKLAFDHSIVILSGIERLKSRIKNTDIVFNMMPKYFTLGELQQVYEVILNKKLLDPAFRRIIKDKVKKTNQLKTGEGHRPATLFKYINKYNQSS